MQQEYGEDAMGRTQVFEWFRRFTEGRTSVESDPHSGRLSTSRNEEMIAKVRTIVRRRLTVGEIADDCGISVDSCDAILTDDLHMKRVCAKFVQLVPAPRQYTRTHFTHCAPVFGQTRHHSVAAAAILTRSRTV